MQPETFTLVAKTFQGLEEVLASEIAALGGKDIEIGKRMVSFTGDKALLYKTNLHFLYTKSNLHAQENFLLNKYLPQ